MAYLPDSLQPPARAAALALTPAHRQQLEQGSAIHPDVIADRRPNTSELKHALKDLHVADYQQRVPGILLPVHTVDGAVLPIIWRPDTPRQSKRRGEEPKVIKYDQRATSPVHLDCPPRCRPHLMTPTIPLWITE